MSHERRRLDDEVREQCALLRTSCRKLIESALIGRVDTVRGEDGEARQVAPSVESQHAEDLLDYTELRSAQASAAAASLAGAATALSELCGDLQIVCALQAGDIQNKVDTNVPKQS
ncbi:MAG: hypothetical protein MHM6MM_007063 [Cercozoa sp. M6MM]